jgi:hypothetical protein
MRAIAELTHAKWVETMDPIEVVVLSNKHFITEWLVSAYVKLVKRTKTLSVHEYESCLYQIQS